MKKLMILILITGLLTFRVQATEFSPPDAPAEIEKYMPDGSVSFGKDLWYIIKSVLREVTPDFSEAMTICASVIAILLLISVLKNFACETKNTVGLAGVIALSVLLLEPSKAMIQIGAKTIESINEYHKLLLPVMTAALAAQGGTATAASLYAVTVVLNTILTVAIVNIILPILYGYIALGIAAAAIDEPILKNLLGLIKWLITWLLKISIYIFTGFMAITGVISGTVDSAALKATKVAISNAVPVVGKIISDASETILVGTGILKNSAGVYGALVILTLWLVPFLKIGLQYLLLKFTAGICSLYADKKPLSVVEHISSSMGFVLAMTGTICLLILISLICFMKGMSG